VKRNLGSVLLEANRTFEQDVDNLGKELDDIESNYSKHYTQNEVKSNLRTNDVSTSLPQIKSSEQDSDDAFIKKLILSNKNTRVKIKKGY
jgi:hypothetical protein